MRIEGSWCGSRGALVRLRQALQFHRGALRCPAIASRIAQVPFRRHPLWRSDHGHGAAQALQVLRQPGHHRPAIAIVVGPERDGAACQRLPVSVPGPLGAMAPADDRVIRKQQGRPVRGALTLDDQHRGLGGLQQLGQPVEGPWGRPLAAEGVAAAGAMPAAVQPGAVDEDFVGLPPGHLRRLRDPLDPEIRIGRISAVGMLLLGSAQLRRRRACRWRRGDPRRPAAAPGGGWRGECWGDRPRRGHQPAVGLGSGGCLGEPASEHAGQQIDPVARAAAAALAAALVAVPRAHA